MRFRGESTCDEAMDALEDIITKIVKTFFIEDQEGKRQARIALAEGPITLFLQRFETMQKNGVEDILQTAVLQLQTSGYSYGSIIWVPVCWIISPQTLSIRSLRH